MQSISSLLDNSLVYGVREKKSRRTWRSDYIDEITALINSERVGTKYKPTSPRFISIITSHLKSEQDFHYLLSVGKDHQRRNGSFSKYFFWAIKPHES